MNTSQIIACAITWTAAVAAVIAAALSWRAQQDARNVLIAVRAERRTFAIPGGGEVTVTAPMSDADYEAFKAVWLEQHGAPNTACDAYQPPAAAEDSGLCARCGMFDYKHQEQPDA